MTLPLNKTKTIRLAIFLSMFFGFFLSFNNGNASAIADKVVTYDSNNQLTEGTVLCAVDECTSYNYIIITNDLNTVSTSRFNLEFSGNKSYRYYPDLSGNTIYNLKSSISTLSLTGLNNMGSSVYTGDKKLTITLTETNPSAPPPSGSLTINENGSYDVSQYASVNVDIENITEVIEDPISNDFQKVFFEIVKNIIPAFGILLVVWFGIDMLSSLIFGRGR